jgi:phenylacetate-CoA ligase
MAEAAANISECPEGKLHIDEDFGCVELLPVGDDTYKIIGTGYSNFAFPLIRYDTGDIAEIESGGKSCTCGCPGKVVKAIDGRIEDYILTPEGNRIGRMDHIFKDMINIRECQIYQDKIESVVFRVVKGNNYSERDEKQLLDEARKRLGNSINIELSYVDSIEKTARGKLRFVISKLDTGKITGSHQV